MNIGITCYPTYGGSGIVGSELGKELAKRGHTVHFISYALPTRITELSDRVQFHEVEVPTYPLFEHQPYTMALATKMMTVAEDYNLDLLHVHYAIPHSISAYLAREVLRSKRYLPVITTLHGTDITLVGADRSYLPITRFGIEQSDGVTAISEYLRRVTCEVFDVRNVRVIPNFVCPDEYRRRPNHQLRSRLAPDGEKLIVHISNFRPVKRITDCVEVFARLRGKLKARLVMIGDGPDRSAAEWLARSYSVEKDVLFVGKQPVIVDYLSVADLLLLPSQTESFGLVALEAMACEVPVVASRVGGVPEVVVEGETGYFAQVGDVETMADHALKILASDELQRRLGQRGREIAIARFHTDKVIPLYLEFYDEILASRFHRC